MIDVLVLQDGLGTLDVARGGFDLDEAFYIFSSDFQPQGYTFSSDFPNIYNTFACHFRAVVKVAARLGKLIKK